jgi:chromosome segregation protein
MMALEEYQEASTRHEFLNTQQNDLLDSIRDTQQAIQEIDAVSKQQFETAFEAISTNFQETFRTLFGGGYGNMRLTADENGEAAGAGIKSSEAGIDLIVQPPGKRLQNVLLLSGGEKALTALALLLAVFRYQPSPFCILDEVDAPLDETNIGRFTELVSKMSLTTQFIIITHSKKTMEAAPVLYGVTMPEPGVSRLVSVRFRENPGLQIVA